MLLFLQPTRFCGLCTDLAPRLWCASKYPHSAWGRDMMRIWGTNSQNVLYQWSGTLMATSINLYCFYDTLHQWHLYQKTFCKGNCLLRTVPDSKVRGANMGPIWGRQDPGGPHVGPRNFAICGGMWVCKNGFNTGLVIHLFSNWRPVVVVAVCLCCFMYVLRSAAYY